jgi:radical SAM protein with 4Fe4S-binding SPASM domain
MHSSVTDADPVPEGLRLQWHITERCTLRCAHCYQDSFTAPDPPLATLMQVLEQYQDLLEHWRSGPPRRHVWGQIVVTGGEPFLHPGFPSLLAECARRRSRFGFAILSNGTAIDAAQAKELHALRPDYVQISIDGDSTTHDRVRGPGSFDRATAALGQLRRAGVKTLISFTTHRGNVRDFPAVVALGRRLGVDRVWTDRLIPECCKSELNAAVLSPDETCDWAETIARLRGGRWRRRWGRTQVAAHRALQFMGRGDRPYHCTAGDSLICVLPQGDLLPCRRLPIRAGNVFDRPLADLYRTSPVLADLRDATRPIAGCEPCALRQWCRGGLRCLAYAVTGDPFRADPGCWRAAEGPEPAGAALDPADPSSGACETPPRVPSSDGISPHPK